MDTLPLPPRPNLEQYKKRAKELVAAARSGDPKAIRVWASEWIQALARTLEVEITPFIQSAIDRSVERLDREARDRSSGAGTFTLADAQFLIAQAHSFENWAAFVNHLDPASRAYPEGQEFEAAADAVVLGELDRLRSLLRAHPDLIRARSRRTHRATLLHYVAANGVEDWRQKTPPNAVAIALLLIEAGGEVDALAETYGGGSGQTTMNLLVSSTHPANAGLQEALVDALLDHGAAIDGLEVDGSPIMTALSFGYGGAAETLSRRGALVNNIASAAAVGRLDLVAEFYAHPERLKPVLPGLYWIRLPNDFNGRNEFALVWACEYGRVDVVEFLLARGVSPAAANGNRMTCLHEAAAHGHMRIVDLLLDRGAPLEVENVWGGTVLNSTLHFAFHMPDKGVDYPAIVARLVAAGADVSVVDMPTGDARIDQALVSARRSS